MVARGVPCGIPITKLAQEIWELGGVQHAIQATKAHPSSGPGHLQLRPTDKLRDLHTVSQANSESRSFLPANAGRSQWKNEGA